MDVKVLGFLLVGLLIGTLAGYGLAPKGVSQEEYNALQEQVKSLENQVSDLQEKVSQYEGQISDYEKQVSDLKEQINEYEKRVSELEGMVYTVNIAYKDGVGYYLVDKEGRALYYFAKDVPNSGKSACYGDCAQKWPVFYEEELNLPPGLDKEDFSVITRDDGSKQLAYKGWPLYYFFKDEKAGDTNGEGVKGVWFVMKPDYTLMIAYKEGIGTYFVDPSGMALYYFAKDVNGTSVCYGDCAQKWPVFAPEEVSAPSTLSPSDFTYITREDGSKQLAYKGWPLYYFFMDEKAGDTNGEDVKHVWYVMRDYDVMIAYQDSVGTYLVDDMGMTLYYFVKDNANMSVCYGDCAQKWPAFYRENPVAPSVIAGDFGEITREDGMKQTTFRGYPLYYFFMDKKRGDLKGQGVKDVWFVVNPFNFP
ncbi:hypothetical protein [Thermococcus alcaliphilus]|uniref:hypothetical protein n=1 Tax=Thermococcus alcaliphilus TaxID=139207 RepID=UPI0020912474|nr:hypothetical protein [Thermococcus alcaliphilus]MCO6042090.1 hypothetical protein [Thermococcus alcaliphilus]